MHSLDARRHYKMSQGTELENSVIEGNSIGYYRYLGILQKENVCDEELSKTLKKERFGVNNSF